MKRILSLVMIISLVFYACGREEERKTVSNSGSGAAVGNAVTESAVSGGAVTGSVVSGSAAGEEEKEYTENKVSK